MTDPSLAARADLLKIFQAAIDAAEPGRLTGAALRGELTGSEQVAELVAAGQHLFVLAVGKAALKMAVAAQTAVGDRISAAIAITGGPELEANRTIAIALRATRILAAGHPIPDHSSYEAGQAAIAMLERLSPSDLLIVLLSGGASAMLVAPAGTITLEDKITVTSSLLRVRASIAEINTVRKHLSAIKGGRLLRLCKGAKVLGLILSDVRGNDLATIGSGLTAADRTTFEEARGVLLRHSLWGRTPERVREYLEAGAAGEFEETVKAGDPALEGVTNVIVGDNGLALAAAGAAAQSCGYQVDRWRELYGEARDLGRALAAHLSAIRGERRCVIAGGEPVVTVRGGGRGGRAQELALALAIELARLAPDRRIAALCAGSDGRDGPTDAAGGFATPATASRARASNFEPEQALARNNSYPALDAAGDLFRSGPTGTNVADIFIALVNY